MNTPKYCGEKGREQEHLWMCCIAYLGIFLSERCWLLMSSSVSYFSKRHACTLSSTPAFPFLVWASSNHKNRDQSTKNNTTQKQSKQSAGCPNRFNTKPQYSPRQNLHSPCKPRELTPSHTLSPRKPPKGSHSLKASHIVIDDSGNPANAHQTGRPWARRIAKIENSDF